MDQRLILGIFISRLAGTFGLRLVFRQTFDEFYHKKQSEGHTLLERMRALEVNFAN